MSRTDAFISSKICVKCQTFYLTTTKKKMAFHIYKPAYWRELPVFMLHIKPFCVETCESNRAYKVLGPLLIESVSNSETADHCIAKDEWHLGQAHYQHPWLYLIKLFWQVIMSWDNHMVNTHSTHTLGHIHIHDLVLRSSRCGLITLFQTETLSNALSPIHSWVWSVHTRASQPWPSLIGIYSLTLYYLWSRTIIILHHLSVINSSIVFKHGTDYGLQYV